MSIRFIKDKHIDKKQYSDKDEYKYDKKTNVIPVKSGKLLCIIFSEDKGAYFIWRKYGEKTDCFRFKTGKYIIDNESIHIAKNGTRVSFYLEGISTPIKMSNIEKELVKVKYIDLDGTEKETVIQKIKGLKFDSKILDIFTNRQLAENFTKQSIKGFEIFILIISIITLIVACIACCVSYFFR